MCKNKKKCDCFEFSVGCSTTKDRQPKLQETYKQLKTSTHSLTHKQMRSARAVFIALTVYQIKFYCFISGHTLKSQGDNVLSFARNKHNHCLVLLLLFFFLLRKVAWKSYLSRSIGTFQLTRIKFKNKLTDYIMHRIA